MTEYNSANVYIVNKYQGLSRQETPIQMEDAFHILESVKYQSKKVFKDKEPESLLVCGIYAGEPTKTTLENEMLLSAREANSNIQTVVNDPIAINSHLAVNIVYLHAVVLTGNNKKIEDMKKLLNLLDGRITLSLGALNFQLAPHQNEHFIIKSETIPSTIVPIDLDLQVKPNEPHLPLVKILTIHWIDINFETVMDKLFEQYGSIITKQLMGNRELDSFIPSLHPSTDIKPLIFKHIISLNDFAYFCENVAWKLSVIELMWSITRTIFKANGLDNELYMMTLETWRHNRLNELKDVEDKRFFQSKKSFELALNEQIDQEIQDGKLLQDELLNDCK
ncbi:MAG: hypothetical protein KAS30_05885, partial [Candidatus Diapherotrites archaeon]|nr:hypothetical protein [Candidatus Diapherotrites archaeon]